LADVLFALDQNFPQPIVNALARYQQHAELVPVWEIDPRLSNLDDWELLLALHHHERPWGGSSRPTAECCPSPVSWPPS